MQKKLIALAIAGLSGAAFAQSNVTIYGVADATFENVSSTGANAVTTALNNTANEFGSRARVVSNSSYLGFKGSEGLGNGLTAVYQFETGIDIAGSSQGNNTNGQTNTAATASWTGTNIRDSFIGIAGGFGTAAIGTLTGPTRALGAALDVNPGATGAGGNTAILGKVGQYLNSSTQQTLGLASDLRNQAAGASVFDTRAANAVAYITPNFNGFTGTFAYVPGETKAVNAAAAANKGNPSGYDVGLKYDNGKAMVALTQMGADFGLDTSSANTQMISKARVTRLGGSYNFGTIKLNALWEKVSDDLQMGANNVQNLNRNAWGIGGIFNATANIDVTAQYYKAANLGGSAATNNNINTSTGASFYSLGLNYNFTKRTMLKVTYARLNNNDNARYDFFTAVGGGTAASAIGGGADSSSFGVGLRHSF